MFIQSFGFPSFLTRGSRAILRIRKIEPRKIICRYSRARLRAVPLATRRSIEVLQKISPHMVKMAPARRHKGKVLFTISSAPFALPFPSSRAVRLDEPIPIIMPAPIITR